MGTETLGLLVKFILKQVELLFSILLKWPDYLFQSDHCEG
jgi:hypothetical protein